MSDNNNFAELVWEKGNILPRYLSTKKSRNDFLKFEDVVPYNESFEPQVASSSVCSSGDSNNPIYTIKRRYEDSNESIYSSKQVHDESVHMKKAKHETRSQGGQRNQTAEVRNLSERKQRGKLEKKMRALQEIIPNCNKVDSVSTLDEAIEYLKILQLQVQMMSMRNGFYMHPMMLPLAIDPIATPHFLHHGLLGFSCSPAQYITSPVSGPTGLSGIPEGSPTMLGYPSQAVPVYNSPFMSLPSGYPAQSTLVPGVSTVAAPVHIPISLLQKTQASTQIS